MKNLLRLATAVALGTAGLYGQTTVDSSGNSLLKGAYRFRQVAVLNTDANGNPKEVCAGFGVITFSGTGTYTVTGGFVDNTISGGAAQSFPANLTGSYGIGSNGTGIVSSPLNFVLSNIYQTTTQNLVYGAVAQGVFTGSDTEDGDVDDIFIAIPVSTPPTNASFTKAYSVGVLDFTGGSSAAVKNAMFNLSPNGQGGFANISVTGQAANQSAAIVSQTVTGATYNFGSDGNATLNIPLPSGTTAVNALFTGSKSMFVSSDGNFVLGWTASGFDIFFGVSSLTSPASNSTFQGTYYLSALEDTPSGNGADSYYGSILSAAGNGSQILHERLEFFGYYSYDYLTDDAVNVGSTGTSTTADYNGYQYTFGDGGKAFVAVGTSGTFTLLVGMQAPVLTGSGVFLNPTGIFNSASYAPITAGIAPGEMLTLFGTGMAPAGTSKSAPAGPVPNLLAGVQVLMNGKPSPVFYVSPTQISAIVPYALTPSSTQFVATIQVNNNGVLSNPVTLYLTDALPGVFTQNQSGIGLGAVLHNADSSLVTEKNPAKVGEFLQVYLTGLGTVSPALAQDGALGPLNPLSYADLFNSSNLLVNFIDFNNDVFQAATVTFAGLAPGYAGLYQINVQVPTGVGPGDVYLDIQTDFSEVSQVVVPVGTSSGAAVQPRSVSHVGPHQQPRPKGQRRDVTPPRMPVRSLGLSSASN